MGRAPCCEKVGLKRGRWTAEEDSILIHYIQAHGEGSWRTLPKNAGLLRCGKSCRLRWINYLRSDLKRGNISVEEEELIIKLHASLGNKWSQIAGHLLGRTDNEIKNYWNSHLSKKLQNFQTTSDQTQSQSSSSSSLPSSPPASTSSSSSSVVTAGDHLAKPGHKRPRTSRQSNSKKKKPRSSSKATHPPPPPEQSNLKAVPVPATPSFEKESSPTSTTTSTLLHMEEDTLENIISGLGPLAGDESTASVVCSTSEFTSYNIVDDLFWVSEEESAAAANILCNSTSSNDDPAPGMILEEGMLCCEDLLAVSDGLNFVNDATGRSTSAASSLSTNDDDPVRVEVIKEMEVASTDEKLELGDGDHHGSWGKWRWEDDIDDDGRAVMHNLSTEVFGENADMLSWLWDDVDDGGGADDVINDETVAAAANRSVGIEILDDEKHNAMVAWLLS